MLYALGSSNVVMIPVRNGAEFKSSNRLLNAVRAGCFVVASQSPAHEEFKRWLWVGPLKAGLDWAKAFPDELNGLVADAQAYVSEHYHPTRIAGLWAQVIGH